LYRLPNLDERPSGNGIDDRFSTSVTPQTQTVKRVPMTNFASMADENGRMWSVLASEMRQPAQDGLTIGELSSDIVLSSEIAHEDDGGSPPPPPPALNTEKMLCRVIQPFTKMKKIDSDLWLVRSLARLWWQAVNYNEFWKS
jgi:hypothetical protein